MGLLRSIGITLLNKISDPCFKDYIAVTSEKS